MQIVTSNASTLQLDRSAAAELVVDIWRSLQRARRDNAPESVRIACERAMERTEALGFEVRDMVGEPYHESMRLTVVYREGGPGDAHIVDCIAPAVYFDRGGSGITELISPAQVVIKGGGTSAAPDC